MIVDQTKTGKANILAMVRPITKLKNYTDAQLNVGVPVVQTPTTSNGMKNTRVGITGVNTDRIRGEATVHYNRLTLPTARPTAGNKVFIDNSDTHADVLAKVVFQHRLVADQVVLTTQTRLPYGRSEALPFKVDPIPNSVIYAAGTLDIQVINQDAFVPQPGSVFFGNSVGTRNGLPVYTVPLKTAWKYFTDSRAASFVNFFRMINYHKTLKHFDVVQRDGSLGPLEIANTSQTANNTYVKVTPRDGSPFSEAFYIFYCRYNIAVNRNMRNAGLQYRLPVNADYLYLFCDYEGIPIDAIEIVSMSQTATSRSIVVRWKNNNFIGYGGDLQTTLRYYW